MKSIISFLLKMGDRVTGFVRKIFRKDDDGDIFDNPYAIL